MRTDQAYKMADYWINWYDVAIKAGYPEHKTANAPQSDASMTAYEYVIAEIMRSINLQIFKRDKDGSILFDKKGRAMLDWVAILSGVIKLVGKIVALSKLYEMRRKL